MPANKCFKKLRFGDRAYYYNVYDEVPYYFINHTRNDCAGIFVYFIPFEGRNSYLDAGNNLHHKLEQLLGFKLDKHKIYVWEYQVSTPVRIVKSSPSDYAEFVLKILSARKEPSAPKPLTFNNKSRKQRKRLKLKRQQLEKNKRTSLDETKQISLWERPKIVSDFLGIS